MRSPSRSRIREMGRSMSYSTNLNTSRARARDLELSFPFCKIFLDESQIVEIPTKPDAQVVFRPEKLWPRGIYRYRVSVIDTLERENKVRTGLRMI